MPDTPAITIAHELPGRVRLRLSHAHGDPSQLVAELKRHAGVEGVDYTPVTRSVLIHFQSEHVSREEIAVRTALSLAVDRGATPVRILNRPSQHEVSESAFYSGFALAVALVGRLLYRGADTRQLLDWVGGLGTAGAVVHHGWSEVNDRGNFDPEVLSLVYLVTSMVRGNILPAALFTWATTFGRHLLEAPDPGVEVRPMEFPGGDPEHPRYEVVVSPDRTQPSRAAFLALLPGAVMRALAGGGESGRGNLLEQIRQVSQLHGEVLEGLGELKHGIPVRVG